MQPQARDDDLSGGAAALAGHELPRLVTPIPGPLSRELSARLDARDCPAFASRRGARTALAGQSLGPIVLARGAGSNLWDVDENRYVDLAAGFGSVLVGHGALALIAAAHAQLDALAQGLGDLYPSDVKVRLLERLARLHPDPDARVLLCQSGADAITAALKTAALETGRPGVVAFERAYHGLGYAALAACGYKASYREPFAAQLSPHVTFAPYPATQRDARRALEATRAALKTGLVGAILIEPILGRGGVVPAVDGALRDLVGLAHEHGAVVVADEIWTGLGRSGHVSAMVAGGATPDILCFGKGLGGSIGISACIGSGVVMEAWASDGEVVHTSTHAGAPLACAAALATLDEIDRQGLVERSSSVGARWVDELREGLAGRRAVADIRGQGLMVGVELQTGALGMRTTRRLLERGFVATSGGLDHEVVVFTPALTVAPAQLSAAAVALAAALSEEGA